MKTATPAFVAAVARSHQLATLVEVLTDGDVQQEITAAVDGTVTLDATAQVRGRLDLTVVDDGTLDLVPTGAGSLLAPYGNELRVSRGIAYRDGSRELVPLGVFRIDETTTSDTANGVQIQITGLDRAARVIDARFETPYQVAAGTNYTTAILDVLQNGWPDIPTDLTATSRTTPQLVAEEGADRWAFAQTMAASIGMVLYFDGDGTCRLRPVTATNAAPVATIAEGENGVLVQAARQWNRQGAFNRVIATGENTAETTPARGVATDDDPDSPTYYYGPFGKAPRFYTSPFITTDDQAQDAAQALLARELGTTQQVSFGSLVDPRLEPDDAVTITRPRAGIGEVHVIDQVTIPLAAAGVMTGRTRSTLTVA